jgi:OFA family oxalate/formate antiporter-like MFS transporter
MPIRAILLMILMPFGTFMGKKYGPRPVVMAGAIGMTTFVFTLAYTKSPILFVIVFSLAFGIPTIGFYIPMMCAWKYFPGKRSVLTGLSVCGFSLGPLIFSYICHMIVNPNDVPPKEYNYGAIKQYYFEEEVYSNVPKLFITLGIIWGLIFCYIVFAVENPPKEYCDALAVARQAEGRRSTCNESNQCPDVSTALKHRTFWILITLLTIATWNDFIFGLAYKEIGFSYQYSDSYLTLVGILYSMANAAGRISWGIITQKYPFVSCYQVILAGQVFFSLTLVAVARSPLLYVLWIMLSTLFTSGNFVAFAPLTMKIYGPKYGERIYTLVATAFATGAFVLYFVNTFVLPHIGYKLMLELVGIISASGYLLLWMAELKPDWNK